MKLPKITTIAEAKTTAPISLYTTLMNIQVVFKTFILRRLYFIMTEKEIVDTLENLSDEIQKLKKEFEEIKLMLQDVTNEMDDEDDSE